jgi:hypothetical protein
MKKYIVDLTEDERTTLQALVQSFRTLDMPTCWSLPNS